MTLDQYLDRLLGRRVLIKIDAEGSEGRILQGARRVIEQCAPVIVFEAWADAENRRRLFAYLQDAGYRLRALSPPQGQPGSVLSLQEFLTSGAENFLAHPSSAHEKRSEIAVLANRDSVS
jgi:hypothetical protein